MGLNSPDPTPARSGSWLDRLKAMAGALAPSEPLRQPEPDKSVPLAIPVDESARELASGEEIPVALPVDEGTLDEESPVKIESENGQPALASDLADETSDVEVALPDAADAE